MMYVPKLSLTIPVDKAWFTSDPHFDHTNIIRYSGRPFANAEEMNQRILENLHARVQPADFLFFLGDMSYGRGSRSARWWLSQLPGVVIYVKGSHDKDLRSTSTGLRALTVFDSFAVGTFYLANGNLRDVTLSHEPFQTNEWNIHGHVHRASPLHVKGSKRIHVGLDVNHFQPVSLAAVIQIMEEEEQLR